MEVPAKILCMCQQFTAELTAIRRKFRQLPEHGNTVIFLRSPGQHQVKGGIGSGKDPVTEPFPVGFTGSEQGAHRSKKEFSCVIIPFSQAPDTVEQDRLTGGGMKIRPAGGAAVVKKILHAAAAEHLTSPQRPAQRRQGITDPQTGCFFR